MSCAAVLVAASLGAQRPDQAKGLTDVPGVKVGHFTLAERPTGCTVVLTEAGAVAGVDVRGSAPGTRETDLLNPVNTVQQVHAIVLSGGSAFGLDAASGVVRYLDERGIGFDAGVAQGSHRAGGDPVRPRRRAIRRSGRAPTAAIGPPRRRRRGRSPRATSAPGPARPSGSWRDRRGR